MRTKATRKLQEADSEAEFKRGWTPRRRGAIYCSPRCGASCTHAAFELATRKAKALCKRLGPGWEPRVWENMAWHYSVQKGVTEVHANFHKSYRNGVNYSVYFNTTPQFVTSANTPEEAIRQATALARGVVRKIGHDLKVLAA